MLPKFTVRISTATLVALFGTFFVATTAQAATGESPSGQNLGFRIIWQPTAGTTNSHASFLRSDGSSLSMCGVPEQGSPNSSDYCSYDYRYSINGVEDKNITKANFTYQTWPTITDANKNNILCRDLGQNAPQTDGPHTNYNCFNENTYGQVFKPTNSGALSGFTMAMTCLSPTGATSLTANLYETSTPIPNSQAGQNGAQSTISASPIATATFSLSNCATTWSGKVFSGGDFTYPVMDFGSVSLDNTKWYVVLFTGEAVAGTPPTGSVNNTTSNVQPSGSGTSATTVTPTTVEEVPQLAKTGAKDSALLVLALILLFFGYTAYSIGFEEMRKAKVLKWLGLDWLDFKFK